MWYNIYMAIKYTEQMLKDAVASSESYAEVVRKLGAGRSGSTVGHLKRRIINYGIDTSHFTHRNTNSESRKQRTIKEILVLRPEGSSREVRKVLLRAMIESGIKYSCSECPLYYEWNGKILNLEIDHINGNGLDNRIENLRFLCPNCHSQMHTSNHSRAFNPYAEDEKTLEAYKNKYENLKEANKIKCTQCGNQMNRYSKKCKTCFPNASNLNNIKIADLPSLEEVMEKVKNTSYRQAGREYNVTDTTIRNFFKRNGIDPKTFLPFK